jgi:transglutaminase-like putative cysteine protease
MDVFAERTWMYSQRSCAEDDHVIAIKPDSKHERRMISAIRFKHWPESARELTLSTAVVLLALAPHVPHLPFWIPLIVVGCLAWRVTLELHAAVLPNKWLRNFIAIAAMISVFVKFRTLNGLEAGTALLSVMAGMKLLETRDHRDYTILIFIAFFLLFAELLYDQSLWMIPFTGVTTLFCAATLMRLHDGGARLSYSDALKRCVRMGLQAAPLAILLFLFFPRLQGQFWALPSRGGATSGLSDSMSPGDVTHLSLSDDVAFRVEFTGTPPPPFNLYWRAIVLHGFDGRTWRRTREAPSPPSVQPLGSIYEYRLLLEPTNQSWIPVLDVPLDWQLPRSAMSGDMQLVTAEPVSKVTAISVRSTIQYKFGEQLSTWARNTDLQLPERSNPRARELAQKLLSQAGDEKQYINTVLRMFNRENFSYTLEPSPLGLNAVDDFLFNTHNGFCEHYASAFTVLMRSAGIPARVVTGYQGGEFNGMGNYMIVRQADAHAWSEVWLKGEGWVRIDPTAAIAPERVNKGLQSALSDAEPVPGRMLRRFEWLNSMRLGFDAVNTFWKKHIVQFDALKQQSLLANVGIDSTDWRTLGLTLVIIFVIFFLGLLVYLTWRYKPAPIDPAAREYLKLQHKLEALQIVRLPHEGPSDFLKRAATLQPARATQLKDISDAYVALRYSPRPEDDLFENLKKMINEF